MHINSISYRPLLIILGAVLPLTSQAFDTLDGTQAKWQTMPITYSVGRHSPDVDLASEQSAIDEAFDAWTNTTGATIRFQRVSNGNITVDFDQNWPREWGPEAAGITITNRTNSRITSAEIRMNNQYFEWSTSGASSLTDIQGVATHEIGHAIGFGHSFYFESTMYWSGGDAGLRSLAPDDERGIRFLYGPSSNSGGRMCDTCLSNSDCESFCLSLEADRSHCGQACNTQADCPEHSDCFELTGGGRSCAPLALACSDDPRLQGGGRLSLGPGEYCFGADQCRNGAICLPLDTTAECISSCVPDQAPCPNGAECYATGDPDTPGLCVPPGNVTEGGVCGSFQNRCQDGLECAFIGDRPRCFRYCSPGGQCNPGFGCSPFDATRWVCLSTEGPQAGQPCEAGLCGGGLVCMNVNNAPTCVPGCLPEATNSCGQGRRCVPIREGVGGCSPGEIPDGQACAKNLDCIGGFCLFQGGQRVCARGCQTNVDCADDDRCEQLNSGERICIADDENTPPEVLDSGSVNPPARDQFIVSDSATTAIAIDSGMVNRFDASTGPPVIFFENDRADPGCQCSTNSHSSPFPWLVMICFALVVNEKRTGYVRRKGGLLP